MGGFPEAEARDLIVRQNAAIIRRIEQAWEQQPLRQLVAILTSKVVAGG